MNPKSPSIPIKDISVSHIYNLREKRQFVSASLTCTKTQAVSTPIGIRKKPDPQGKPGSIHVDSVHQGDRDGEKGVYHINLVDEVAQWEIVGTVEKISEQYLEPLLEALIAQFPFRIFNFHSDNGSEYINRVVAELLNKLLILQTKSQSRHCKRKPASRTIPEDKKSKKPSSDRPHLTKRRKQVSRKAPEIFPKRTGDHRLAVGQKFQIELMPEP